MFRRMFSVLKCILANSNLFMDHSELPPYVDHHLQEPSSLSKCWAWWGIHGFCKKWLFKMELRLDYSYPLNVYPKIPFRLGHLLCYWTWWELHINLRTQEGRLIVEIKIGNGNLLPIFVLLSCYDYCWCPSKKRACIDWLLKIFRPRMGHQES